MPYCDELCPKLKDELQVDQKECLKMLNSALRKYFLDVSRTLGLLLEYYSSLTINVGSQTTLPQLNIQIQHLLKGMSPETLKRNELTFYDRNKYIKGTSASVCYFCKIADYFDMDYDTEIFDGETKLKNKYSKCCAKFGWNPSSDADGRGSLWCEKFTFDSEFYKSYSRIKYFGVRDSEIEKENKFEKFEKLIDIELDNNKLSKIPESILKLKSLLSLSFKNNPIESISMEAFVDLTSLNTLEMENLRLVLKKDEYIKLPISLQNLIVRNFSAEFIPFDFKNDVVKSLKSLTFSGVVWIDTTPYAPFKMWMITRENFSKRFDKIFNNDHHLSKIFSYFDLNKDNELDPDEVINFNAFMFKKFARLTEIPLKVFSLTNLTRLDLSYQAIRIVPDEIEHLKSLNKLYLTNCILLDSISGKVSLLPLQKLELTGCISLKTPPPEIVNRGLTSILSFLKRLLLGKVLCKKTKLMLVNKNNNF